METYVVMLHDNNEFYFDIPILVKAKSNKEAEEKVSIFLPNNIENYDDAEFEIAYSKKLSDLMKLD